MTPEERFEREYDDLCAALDRGDIDRDTFNAEMRDLRSEWAARYDTGYER